MSFIIEAGDLTMPGCQEYCCTGSVQGVVYRIALERLNRDISGASLVPPLNVIVLAMLVCAAAWRAVGGG